MRLLWAAARDTLLGSVMRDPPFPGAGDMATRKSNLRLSAKDIVSIAGDLGTQARVFNDNEVRQLLRAAVARAGTQVAFAKRHRLDRTHLNIRLLRHWNNPMPDIRSREL